MSTSISTFSERSLANIAAGNIRSRSFDHVGKDLKEATSPEQALALVGADFKVGQTALFSFCKTSESQVIPGTECHATKIDSHKVMWRLDEHGKPQLPLGVVGKGWTPRQPRDAVADLALFAGQGAEFDRGFLTSDSTRLYMRMKVAEAKILGDDMMGYCTLIDGYDGGTGLTLMDEIFREACKNGLVQLVQGSRSLRRKHTKGIGFTREAVMALMNSVRQNLAALAELANTTVNIHLTEARWQGMVHTLLPFPAEATDKARQVVEEQRALLTRLIDVPDLANFNRSGWAALNAVSDFTSHLGTSQRMGNVDNQVRKLYEVSDSNPMLTQARELVLALN